jgi:hypothetical protein
MPCAARLISGMLTSRSEEAPLNFAAAALYLKPLVLGDLRLCAMDEQASHARRELASRPSLAGAAFDNPIAQW